MRQTRQDDPHAFDGVIPPPNKPSGAEGAVERAQSAADQLSQLAADGRTVGEQPDRPSLDDMDAAIAEDADGVIASVFASVEDLLGEGLTHEDLAAYESSEAIESAAAEEDAAPIADATNVEDEVVAAVAEEAPVDVSVAHDNDSIDDPSITEAFDESKSESAPHNESALVPAVSDESPTPKAQQPGLAWGYWARRVIARLMAALHPKRLLFFAAIVLGVVSWPLRFVPEGARPYVDWVALSLVFWIPVIWVIAFFVIGR